MSVWLWLIIGAVVLLVIVGGLLIVGLSAYQMHEDEWRAYQQLQDDWED